MIPPALYHCSVSHQRVRPKRYGFRHRVFFFCFDLMASESLSLKFLRWFNLIGVERPGLYSFYQNDHLPEPQAFSLPERLRYFLRQQGYASQAQACRHILLVTQLRVLGYVFNPVSFYFCLDEAQKPLCAIAEVSNTFGEMKLYVVPLVTDGEPDVSRQAHFYRKVSKLFYVSPFSKLEDQFTFALTLPDETLQISVIDSDAQGDPVLYSNMIAQRVPLTVRALLKTTLLNPWVTMQVILWIHWHALCLWRKGVPHHIKEKDPHLQRDLFHPHPKTFGASTP